MSYSVQDLESTLEVAARNTDEPIAAKAVARVLYAFGRDGDYAEWEGGFVCEMDDGRILMVSGWCDTTGWGCQDGAHVHVFDAEPTRGEIIAAYDAAWEYHEDFTPESIDENPADLNRWIAAGGPDTWEWMHNG